MFHPINGYIVVKKVDKDKMTKGGILLPETPNQNNPIIGEVIAVCPEAKVKVGDLISFRQTTIIKVPDNFGGIHEIIHQDQIFGIWEKDET